jgi:hypothetical protein
MANKEAEAQASARKTAKPPDYATATDVEIPAEARQPTEAEKAAAKQKVEELRKEVMAAREKLKKAEEDVEKNDDE